MKWPMKLSHCVTAVLFSLTALEMICSQSISVTLSPSIITTKKILTVSIDNKGHNFTAYRYSFGSWTIETARKTVNHRYYFPGVYTLMVTALLDGSWIPWTIKKIEVFDYDTVVHSNCEINILPSIQSLTDAVLAGENVTILINITLKNCFGVCQLYVNSTNSPFALTDTFMSYGKNESRIEIFSFTYCRETRIYFQITSLTKVITKVVNLASLWDPKKCRSGANSNRTSNSSNLATSKPSLYSTTQFTREQNASSSPNSEPVAKKGTLNVVVAVFFTLILGFYLSVTFLNYLENKKSLRSVINLTNIDDEIMYEVQFQVGNAFSVQSTACEIQFTAYGTNNDIGPVSLPVSPFEQDGIASFLISTKKPLGEIGTISVFCKDMNLRSDWYLRKIEILSHSQKPSGSHWGNDDVIKSIAEFECHTWFQPALKTDSVAQIFHSNIVGNEVSLLLYYLRRCHQLFSQKHILTSWRSSIGVKNFSKTQRLSFLYTLWFVIISMSSTYIVKNDIKGFPKREHRYRIGVLRLDKSTADFALIYGTSAYVIGIVLCFVVKLVHGQASDDESLKPDHVDSRGYKIYDMGRKNETRDLNSKDVALHVGDQVDSTVKEITVIDEQKNGSLNAKGDFEEEGIFDPESNQIHADKGTVKRSLEVNNVVLELDSLVSDKKEELPLHNYKNGGYHEAEKAQEKEFTERGVQGSNGHSLQIETSVGKTNENNEVVNDCVAVQFFNRETLPTVKEEQWKLLIFKFSARVFWIAFTILLLFCLFYSLVNSTEWSRDLAYHWLSFHVLAFLFSCFLIDTARVLLYILFITFKERKRLHSRRKRLSFDDHTVLILGSKHAAKQRESFCLKEYPRDKMKFAQDYRRLQGKFRDLFVFGIFVISLLILTTWTVDRRSYRINKTLTQDLLNFKDLRSIQKDKNQVDPIVKFWSWFEKTLFPILDPTKRDVSLQALHLTDNRLVIGQRRVIPGKCNIAEEIRDIVSDCSLKFNEDNEDDATYARGWKTFQPGSTYDPLFYAWEYKGSGRYLSNSSSQPFSSQGYVGYFDMRLANATLNELKKFNWIDRYSRRLYLESFIFDASLNLMSQIALDVEFQRSGYIDIGSSFFSFTLLSESSPNREWIQIVETVSLVLTVYFAFDIVKRKRRTSVTWISLWLIIQTILTALSVTTLSLYFYKDYNVYLLALESVSSYRKFLIYREVIKLQRILENILAMLNIVALVFLTKPLFTLGLFDDMYTAVSRTMRDMSGIAMETCVLLIGLGCWANLAFAGEISSFSSLRTTFPTLMDMLVRPDNSALYEVKFFGPLFLFVYFSIMILFVTNIFISSVENSYSEAREVIDQIRRETVFKLLFKKAKKDRLAERSYLSFESRTVIKRKNRKLQAEDVGNSTDAIDNNNNNNIKSEEKMDGTGKPEEIEAKNDSLITSLEQSIAKLEATMNEKILYEHIEDKILMSAMTDKWNKVILKRPPLSVISLYKPLIRK